MCILAKTEICHFVHTHIHNIIITRQILTASCGKPESVEALIKDVGEST